MIDDNSWFQESLFHLEGLDEEEGYIIGGITASELSFNFWIHEFFAPEEKKSEYGNTSIHFVKTKTTSTCITSRTSLVQAGDQWVWSV